VSTRKLIGLAMVCGLAILIAGGIQLFRIADARDDPVDVLTVGESGTVGSVEASVTEVVQRSPLVLSVAVTAGAGSVGVPELSSAWLVTGDGRARRPVAVPEAYGPPCTPDPVPPGEARSCLLAFEAADGQAFARFRVGDRVLVWGLDGAGEGRR
jgi:hypothetical protein